LSNILHLTIRHVNILLMATAVKKPRLYGGLSADKRRADRRARLIEAAVRVYGKVGYRNATVKAVCAAAELTERYFYESFANSEALLVAAYIHVTDKLHAEMAAAGAAARGGTRTADVLTLYFTRLKENPQPSRVFLLEMNGISDAVDAVRMDSLKRMSAVLLPGRAGAQASDPMPLSVSGAMGAVIGIARRWVAQNYRQPVVDVIAVAAQFCAVAQLTTGRDATVKKIRT
jgi:AcrR family transcriptional regulator